MDPSLPVPEAIEQVRTFARSGFDLAVSSQIFGYDALTLLAVIGREVPDIQLMTSVVPTYPRHPIMLAGQALTVQAMTEGRLVLGIGLSHQIVIEGMFGYSFDRPARHMRDYLRALMPLLRGEQIAYEGETLKAATMAPLGVEAPAPPVLVAALAPVMLKLAGSLADGTTTWMTGPATVESHIVPSITKAAEEAGRPAPRVAVSLPVCVTDDVDGARQRAAKVFAIYGQLPSYAAMIEREGASGPADVAIVGDGESVAARIRAIADVGATEFVAAPYGSRDEQARTFEVVADLARAGSRS